MNKNLGYYIRKFLDYYLRTVRNLSNNTIYSYRDTIKLFLNYIIKSNNIKIEDIELDLLNKNNIVNFLNWIENERKDSINTRNQRLACIKSLCQFILYEDATTIGYIQDIFSIKKKKYNKKEIKYLTKDEISNLLTKPDISTLKGKRDLVILSLLYDAGLRVSELINLKVKDIIILKPISRVKVINTKNNKSREIPITDNTKALLEEYIKYQKLENDMYLIQSNKKDKYTSNGIRKIINKYTKNINFRVTPHTFRHTKASHLVETNVPIIYIRDFLGHESIDTTLIYAKINSKLKNESIINNSLNLNNTIKYNLEDDELMNWLENL